MCAGTIWRRQATKAALSAWQLRYGLITDGHEQKAMQTAMRNSKNKYTKIMAHDE